MESMREISEIVKISHSTIHDIIKRYKTNNQVENKPKKAHNKIFTDADERYLVRNGKVNSFLSAPKLAIITENELGKKANPSTIRNVFHKKNLNGRKTLQKPFINGKPYAWRKSNEELRRQNLKPTVKHDGGSVMVRGSFSAAGPGTLHFVEGRMDQNVYLDILKTNLPLCVQKLSLDNNLRFYQDNDPKHKAYRVHSWLLYNCPHVMETLLQSPDINPIENL
ncbi:transposable element Tc1 transposase [Trichonephila clavipes]|nr:transposable element Tc1 transposase [Trichonephila clavipes]